MKKYLTERAMQKLIFVAAILCSSISNTASGPVEDRGALTGRSSEKNCESSETRRNAVIAALCTHSPKDIALLIVQYIEKWVRHGAPYASQASGDEYEGRVYSLNREYRLEPSFLQNFLEKISPPRAYYLLSDGPQSSYGKAR